MFPIGESLAIRNLERAVFAGRERPAGTAVSTLRSGVRPSRVGTLERWSPRSPRVTGTARRDGGPHVAVRRSPVAGRGAGARGLRGQGTARRGRRSPRSGPVFARCGSRRWSPRSPRETGTARRGRRSPRCGPAFDDRGSEYVAAFARCGSRRWSPRSPRETMPAGRERRSPDHGCIERVKG